MYLVITFVVLTVSLVAGFTAVLAPPILLGVLLRTAFRRSNRDLISLLGGAAVLCGILTVTTSGRDVVSTLAPLYVNLWQTSPFAAATTVIFSLFGAMALPFLMVRVGVNLMDRIRERNRNPEQSAPLVRETHGGSRAGEP